MGSAVASVPLRCVALATVIGASGFDEQAGAQAVEDELGAAVDQHPLALAQIEEQLSIHRTGRGLVV